MISALEEIEAPPTITEEAPVSVSSKAKMEVKVLVQKLVTRLFKNAKVNHDIGNAVGIVESLLEKVWAKVEGQSFTVTPDTFQTLDKVVYKDLVRIWGCAESVVVTFNMEGSSEENCIASIFKARLMSQPKKRGAVCKFLRSVGKAISKPFRRSSEPVWVL
ncbi:Cytochrome P450 71B3 [Dissostichus eleginoides]|nr:Cytochrome P450 71B3 [Dissostichus eleginoides]